MRVTIKKLVLTVSALLVATGVLFAQEKAGKIKPPFDGAYLGANSDAALGNPVKAIADLEMVLGRRLAIHPSFWSLVNGSKFQNHKDLSQIASDKQIQDDLAKGRYPIIGWGCSSDMGVTFQAVADGNYDSNLIAAADAIRQLGAPIFIRPTWEFNANLNDPADNPNGNNCFSQGNVGNSAAEELEFIAYFQHVVTVFKQRGARNVTWVWCPSVNANLFQKTDIPAFYPGDRFVDWIGGDSFDHIAAPVRGFIGIWTQFWTAFNSYGKPMMIAETGEYNNATDEFTQQKFFDDATAALQPSGAFYRNWKVRISALTYFDSTGESGENWSVDSPVDAGGESAWAAMAQTPFFERCEVGAPGRSSCHTPQQCCMMNGGIWQGGRCL